MGSPEVFDPKMARSVSTASARFVTAAFTSRFSKTASTTTSQPARSS